jgi:hypothetical protein
LISTPYGFANSDNRFGDVVGEDGIPEIAVGRLPVVSSGELSALVDKIIAYEESPDSQWRRTMVLAADAPDQGGDFTADGQQAVQAVASTCRVESVLLGDTTLEAARQQLLGAIDSGAAYITYIGHGGFDRLARQGLLTSSDVDTLTNGTRLPVIVAATCAAGQYGVPGRDCLAETLVRRADGGAVAVWAPSTLALNVDSRILARYFHEAVAAGATRLGDALRSAMIAHGEATAAGPEEVAARYTYNVLGDPATILREADR